MIPVADPVLVLLLAFLPLTSCCTYFEAPSGVDASPAKIVTRSMEYQNLLGVTGWQMVTHPRGTKYRLGLKRKTERTVHYGHVSIESSGVFTTHALEGIISDGMNEEGLSISCNMFYSSVYAKYDSSESANQLLFLQLGRWALSEFANTSDFVSHLRNMTVSSLPLNLQGDVTIHWAVTDAVGDSRVIECTNASGKCDVYSNDVGVLTNDPAYPWMVENLNNYAFLSPDWVLKNNNKIKKKYTIWHGTICQRGGFQLEGLTRGQYSAFALCKSVFRKGVRIAKRQETFEAK